MLHEQSFKKQLLALKLGKQRVRNDKLTKLYCFATLPSLNFSH